MDGKPDRSCGLWLTGGCAGLLVLACGLAALLATYSPRAQRLILRGEGGDSIRVVEQYLDAVSVQDWERAHGYLASGLQRTYPAEQLRREWEERVAGDGEPVRFEVDAASEAWTNERIFGETEVRLYYTDGRTERRSVELVREGWSWRLASLP